MFVIPAIFFLKMFKVKEKKKKETKAPQHNASKGMLQNKSCKTLFFF